MTQPPPQIEERDSHVIRPSWMCVLLRDPGLSLLEFFGGRGKGDTVRKVSAAITERKELGLQQIGASQRRQIQRLSLKNETNSALPSSGKTSLS
jgi:hypothetical protein